MIDHLLSALEITYRSWSLFSADSRKLLMCCCGAKSRRPVYQEVAATPSASRRARYTSGIAFIDAHGGHADMKHCSISTDVYLADNICLNYVCSSCSVALPVNMGVGYDRNCCVMNRYTMCSTVNGAAHGLVLQTHTVTAIKNTGFTSISTRHYMKNYESF